jgi:hypothetical protein
LTAINFLKTRLGTAQQNRRIGPTGASAGPKDQTLKAVKALAESRRKKQRNGSSRAPFDLPAWTHHLARQPDRNNPSAGSVAVALADGRHNAASHCRHRRAAIDFQAM